MCYLKFHKCRFCSTEYLCNLPNYHCPSINGDRDADMCALCKQKLEDLIAEFQLDIAKVTLEEIMELNKNDPT